MMQSAERDIRDYLRRNRRRGVGERVLLLIGALLLAVVIGSVLVHKSYNDRLKPVSNSTKSVYVTIASGTPPADIAELLYDDGLIRSPEAFVWYVTSHNQRDKLQAGTYRLAPNMSTPKIATMIANGKVASDLVTILSGQTITEIRKTLITAGFKVTDVDTALRPELYASHPALADNPKGATLEGFLYPDSYQKTSATSPQEIVVQALDEMQAHLTAPLRNAFAAQGLSVYKGVTMASIVEKEVAKPAERPQVAQVFLSRLRQNMRFGSNVTKDYAEQVNDPSYNTFQVNGLPPGPIATISEESLNAVANPAATGWLYFVTGDDGTTHFSKTFEEHQQLIAKYCHKLCG
jgi:UPF0755 protein